MDLECLNFCNIFLHSWLFDNKYCKVQCHSQKLVIVLLIGTAYMCLPFWSKKILGRQIEFQNSVYVVAVALKLQDGRHVACFAFSFALACSGTPWPNQHNEKFKYVISHEETLEESCSTLVSNSSSSFLTQLCTVNFLIIVVFYIPMKEIY